MTTELMLGKGTEHWADVAAGVESAVVELIDATASTFAVTMPETGQRIDAFRLTGGALRLSAAGNETLIGGNRLTVRDERAVIAVGFSVASTSWGTFYWDWTAPITPAHVASGIVRTMRDIYKADPQDLELSVTL